VDKKARCMALRILQTEIAKVDRKDTRKVGRNEERL
jgi:hypothetical protein